MRPPEICYTNQPQTIYTDPVRIADVKSFIKRHKTGLACTLTAAVTYKLTRDHMTDIVTDCVYRLGKDAGVRDIQLTVLQQFVDAHDLHDELDGFVKQLHY